MTAETQKNSILIVDDHQIVRTGLKRLIESEPDLSVCCEAGNAQEALDHLENKKPDLMILDISLNGIDGIELTKSVTKRFPNVLILIFSMHDESLFAERCLHAGAHGYIMKQNETDKLIEAIHKILAGNIYLSEACQSQILKKVTRGEHLKEYSFMEKLSDREWIVFELIGKGYGTRQIAEKLSLGIKTIETHKEKIKKKLNLKNAAELAQKATFWTLPKTRGLEEEQA